MHIWLMIIREMKRKLLEIAKKFPAVAILGPRQSGKTTLAQTCFPRYIYVSLEDLDRREFAKRDPRGFLETYLEGEGVIFDEIQHAPDLFSYIQTEIDRKKRPGFFILTGSQNFLIDQKIGQTLAGRIYIFTLLPLTLQELGKRCPKTLEVALYRGFYPSIYVSKIAPADWYSAYLRTYVERDVRQVQNITDLSTFQRFIKLCAGRVGQILNLTSLGNDCGVSANTARAWISLLEASYIIFLLRPFHRNFSKRLIKSPKIYFYDPGLACHLLDIHSHKELSVHYLKGGLFESMVIGELMKRRYNRGLSPHCHFWRDKSGNEVDCIIEEGKKITSIEIKAAKTISTDFFRGLIDWRQLAESSTVQSFLIYGGDENQKRKEARVLSWRSIDIVH